MKNTKKFKYRETIKGPRDSATIEKYKELLIATRNAFKYGNVNPVTAKQAFDKLAQDKDSDWRLATERDSWSTSQGNKFRMMLRDVQQGVSKAVARSHKAPPSWVQPFLGQSTAGGVSIGDLEDDDDTTLDDLQPATEDHTADQEAQETADEEAPDEEAHKKADTEVGDPEYKFVGYDYKYDRFATVEGSIK